MKGKIRSQISAYKIIIFAVLVLYALTMFFVIYWCTSTALKTKEDFYLDHLYLPPGAPWNWAWGNFGEAFNELSMLVTLEGRRMRVDIWGILGNTIVYTVGGAFVATFVPCCVAYVTAKFPSKTSSLIYSSVIIIMALPIVGNLPSMLSVLQTLGLYDTLIGSLILKMHFLNMYFLVFYATFKGVAKDYAEAAYIDGASELRIFAQIMLPLVRTGFLTIMLIFFIDFWNDYQTPLLYMPNHPTLSYAVLDATTGIASGKGTLDSTPKRMVTCIIMVIPTVILFLCFKNKMLGNLSMGGVKG